MEKDSEIEEGEIFVHNIEHLSYLDERIERMFGHFRKHFEGGISVEKLGPMSGDHGTFLPLYQSLSQPKVPFRPLQEDTEIEEGKIYHAKETEEGEICRNNMEHLSYLDERIERLLGHCLKDFEGGVSAKKSGPMFGGYGTFLPVYLLSSKPKVPFRPAEAQEKFTARDDHRQPSTNNYKLDQEDDSGGCGRRMMITGNRIPASVEDDLGKNSDVKKRMKKKHSPNKSCNSTTDQEKIELLRTKAGSAPKTTRGCVRRMQTSFTVADGEESPTKLMRRKMKQIKAIRYCIRQPKITKSRYW